MDKRYLKLPDTPITASFKYGALSQNHFYLWMYVLLLAAAELVTVYIDPIYGIICHAILLLGLLIQAALTFQKKVNALYLSLTLLPLIRMMSLSMPLDRTPPLYCYLAISIPLFAAAFLVVRLAGYKREDISLNWGKIPVQMAVSLLGIPLGFIEYQFLKPNPLITEITMRQIWLPVLIMMISTGFLEELIFCGMLLKAAEEVMGFVRAVFYASAFFAVLHIIHRSAVDLLFVLAVAFLFSLIVKITRSIMGVSLAHGLTNIGLYLIWPFLC